MTRLLGIAHVEALPVIADPGRRAACETHALRNAREVLVDGGCCRRVGELAALARATTVGGGM
jgi:5-methylthioribose kinase